MTRIDDIEARANAATEGPWEARDGDQVYSMAQGMEYSSVARAHDEAWFDEPDAEFIAHARTDIPDLVTFVRDVEARHVPSKTKLQETSANLSTAPGVAPDNWTLSGLKTVEVSSCDACHMPWPCADRRALDRLNGDTHG